MKFFLFELWQICRSYKHLSINVKNHRDGILRKKIKLPFSPFLKFFKYCFWQHMMLENIFEDLEFSKQITLVESRAFSKFESVELKYQGVLVDLVSQIKGTWTQNHPDRLKGIPPLLGRPSQAGFSRAVFRKVVSKIFQKNPENRNVLCDVRSTTQPSSNKCLRIFMQSLGI